jgi:NAD(P)-dependent dehydrogenase (short-subunit alcohol dehydrogenase family)
MDLALNGKIALVTGAASGVGREIALGLAAEGARVALNYRSSGEAAQRIVEEIAAKGGTATAYRGDVADFAAVKSMIDQIADDFGGLNILINNAGAAIRQPFIESKPEDWRRQIDTCLYGAIHCCHAAAPHLNNAKNGRIVPRARRNSARRGVGRRQSGKVDQALSGAPPRIGRRRGADGDVARFAARRLDHRAGDQH